MEKDIETRVNEFNTLSHDKKKERLLNFIWWLHDKEWYFSNLHQRIKNKADITDEQMVKIYQYIIEYAQELRNMGKKWEKQLIDKLKEKINKLREEEAAKRLQENPDQMMDDFLNTI